MHRGPSAGRNGLRFKLLEAVCDKHFALLHDRQPDDDQPNALNEDLTQGSAGSASAAMHNANETSSLFDKAKSLLQQNSDRFAHYNDYDGKTIYVRRKGDTIVEAVLLTKTEGRLYVVDVTGNMTEAVIKSLINS